MNVANFASLSEGCRLCGSPTAQMFDLLVMATHNVSFFECEGCGSLQSEAPYWLEEAYAQSNLAALDTGAAQRNLNNLAATFALAKICRVSKLVDYGGGDGLLCRLLRDYGLNGYVNDLYAINTYAQGYEDATISASDLVTAFEVIEHYADPVTGLSNLFGNSPRVILLSTALYSGQGSGWWYLSPESGQHVFFYSRQALEWVGRSRGYEVVFAGHYTVFLTNGLSSNAKQFWIRAALNPVVIRILKALLMLIPARGVAKDYESLTGRPVS